MSQIDKFGIQWTCKLYKSDSILEALIDQLKEIQKEKTFSNEECGKEFANLLTKPPPEPVVVHHDDYYDEYGDEYDYGAEDYHHSNT